MQIYDVIGNPDNPESTLTKMKQYKAAPVEKVNTVKQVDVEILDTVEESEVENEINKLIFLRKRRSLMQQM